MALRNESEEELFGEMLTPTQSQKESSEEREGLGISEKDKPCLTKMMTALLSFVSSGERMPDREWVRSDRREESRGIRKEGDKLRFCFWLQTRSTGRDKIKCRSLVLLAWRPPAFH